MQVVHDSLSPKAQWRLPTRWWSTRTWLGVCTQRPDGLGEHFGGHMPVHGTAKHSATGQSPHKMLFGVFPRPMILDSTNLGGMMLKEDDLVRQELIQHLACGSCWINSFRTRSSLLQEDIVADYDELTHGADLQTGPFKCRKGQSHICYTTFQACEQPTCHISLTGIVRHWGWQHLRAVSVILQISLTCLQDQCIHLPSTHGLSKTGQA